MRGKKEIRSWIIPMRFTYDGTALVEASSEEEAVAVAKSGAVDMDPGSGLVDWEVTGKPRENL